MPAVEQWRYRNKLEYSFGERDDGELAARLPPPRQLGRDRRRRGLPARLGGQQRAPATPSATGPASEGLTAYDSRAETGVLRNLVVREGRRTGQIQTRLVTSAGEIPRPPVDLHTVIEGPTRRHRRPHRRARRRVPRRGALRPALARSRTRAFLQTNTEMAERLYADRLRVRRPHRHASASSTSTAGSARSASRWRRQAGEVWGVESVAEAVADAEHNAAANGIRTRASAPPTPGSGSRPLLEEAGTPDVVVVDPPRAGPVEEDRPPACSSARRRGSSTSPATRRRWRRTRLRSSRRAIGCARVKPVDMFPQTPHVECVARLREAE